MNMFDLTINMLRRRTFRSKVFLDCCNNLSWVSSRAFGFVGHFLCTLFIKWVPGKSEVCCPEATRDEGLPWVVK